MRVLRLVESCCVQEVWVLADGHQAGGDNGKLQMADGKGDPESGILTEGNKGNEEGERDGKGDDEEWVLSERVTLRRDGAALPFIPFVFHGFVLKMS